MKNYLLFISAQSILLILLIIFISIFIKEKKYYNLEKRIDNFSLISNKDNSIPFFEIFFRKLNILLKKSSKILLNSELISKYGQKYEKFISFDNKEVIDGIDYVTLKFAVSILLGILYIISTIFKLKFNYMFLLLIMIVGFFILDIYLYFEFKYKRKQIENDLLSAIIIMNNAFKSGMNIIQAVSIVKEELKGPISDEFKKISVDITYGLDLDVVFDRFYKRVKIEDAKYITSSLSLLNKTGGNIVKVFGSIEKNFYDKKTIKDEMNSLTSSSIFMYRLLILMPILLVIIINILNPEYFIPLYTTSFGRIIIMMILLLFIIYIFVVKKIMKVNV